MEDGHHKEFQRLIADGADLKDGLLRKGQRGATFDFNAAFGLRLQIFPPKPAFS